MFLQNFLKKYAGYFSSCDKSNLRKKGLDLIMVVSRKASLEYELANHIPSAIKKVNTEALFFLFVFLFSKGNNCATYIQNLSYLLR